MIRAIAIDLDDTLLDTSGLLTPSASRETFKLMQKYGLKLDLETCENYRKKLVRTKSHRELFEQLALEYGSSETRNHLNEIYDSFYYAPLPEELPLMDFARENLNYLKLKYELFLVTAGIENSQMAKVKALGISSDFEEIVVVNSLIKQKKKIAFTNILERYKFQPSEMLCIGNSLLSEIKDAMELGAMTCYFEHGEERGQLADLPKRPDFHVRNHKDLVSTCKL